MTHQGKLALDKMLETAEKAAIPMPHYCATERECEACAVTGDHDYAARPAAVQTVGDYVAGLESEVRASDELANGFRRALERLHEDFESRLHDPHASKVWCFVGDLLARTAPKEGT